MGIIEQYDLEVQPLKTDEGWIGTRASKYTRYYTFERTKGFFEMTAREEHSLELLKMALERSKKPVVSCSFGADSIVTLYLVRRAMFELGRSPKDIQVIWNDTLNEFPEVRKYAKWLTEEWELNLIQTRPKKPLKKVISDNGGITDDYFTARKGGRGQGKPLSEKCCNTLKHEPMKRARKEVDYDLIINGIRYDESSQRKIAGLRDGEFFYSVKEWKSLVCRPILWWDDETLWDYIEAREIPMCELYEKNLIQKYPDNAYSLVIENELEIEALGGDIQGLLDQQISTVNRKLANYLKKIGFQMFNPRVGCQMCPIPVKYGYLQWIRMYYPKVFDAMVYNLGYGKALLSLVPEDVRLEIKEITGYDIKEEDVHLHLQDIIESKPCVFDALETKNKKKK